MRVLVIGSGAREHALVARLSRDLAPDAVICAPGNPGIGRLAPTVSIDASDVDALLELAAAERIDLTVVGPELPLSLGIVDRFDRAGRAIFGPSQSAARLESSKAFAKAFMQRHRVPTARFRTVESIDEASRTIAAGEFGFPVVIKADGLAAGKGVVIAPDRGAADAALHEMMGDRKFGAAGDRIVIEECLTGPEVSFFVISDGTHAVPIGTAQDHKRIFDDDRGANTGGMGAFAPSPLIDAAMQARVMREIVDPVIAGMAAEGSPFRGFLYAGLMLTDAGPKVIEFNVRLGDPEAQVVLPLIDEPLAPLLAAAAGGTIGSRTVRLADRCYTAVVLASRGYPESAESGQPITGVAAAAAIPGVAVYHAGTKQSGAELVTSGGRVLSVVGCGADFIEATTRAYVALMQIGFDGVQYRHDIGRKALRPRRAAAELG
jgi:phosphoribosylamine--glycine ligase